MTLFLIWSHFIVKLLLCYFLFPEIYCIQYDLSMFFHLPKAFQCPPTFLSTQVHVLNIFSLIKKKHKTKGTQMSKQTKSKTKYYNKATQKAHTHKHTHTHTHTHTSTSTTTTTSSSSSTSSLPYMGHN